jgi:hypothetical protein
MLGCQQHADDGDFCASVDVNGPVTMNEAAGFAEYFDAIRGGDIIIVICIIVICVHLLSRSHPLTKGEYRRLRRS